MQKIVIRISCIAAVFLLGSVMGATSAAGDGIYQLSFGGGGTGEQFMEEGDIYEHSQGIVRNNIVMNCSDAGLYLNKSLQNILLNLI